MLHVESIITKTIELSAVSTPAASSGSRYLSGEEADRTVVLVDRLHRFLVAFTRLSVPHALLVQLHRSCVVGATYLLVAAFLFGVAVLVHATNFNIHPFIVAVLIFVGITLAIVEVEMSTCWNRVL